ncbi:MAG TPA: hypothetical protein VLB46_00930 [Pyrinomonadaceae bacterium]|nr:hypothetical protein [Pyrinomonadaceae bacterium]
MLDLIRPPTDNLYKFQALVGLLLVLVSITYPVWLFRQALLLYFAARNEESQLQIQAEYVQERQNLLQNQMSSMLDDPDQLKKLKERIDDLENQWLLATPSPKRNTLSSEIDRLRKRWQDSLQSRTALVEESQKLMSELRSKKEHLTHQQSVSKTQLRMSRFMFVIGVVGFLIGVAITLRGFRQWSKRVQVYEDIILKRKAETNPSSTA